MCVCGEGGGGILVGQGVKKVESISSGGGGSGVSEASRRQSGPRAGKKNKASG